MPLRQILRQALPLIATFSLVVGLMLPATVLLVKESTAQDSRQLGPSGLPLPRFVSLRSGKVNMRVGPSKDYPIQWVYTRPHWPMMVIDEYEHWRKLEDRDGTTGWVHKSLLSGARYVVVKGQQRFIYKDNDPTAQVIWMAQPGAMARLEDCDGLWCEISAQGMKGWIPRDYLYGIVPEEQF